MRLVGRGLQGRSSALSVLRGPGRVADGAVRGKDRRKALWRAAKEAERQAKEERVGKQIDDDQVLAEAAEANEAVRGAQGAGCTAHNEEDGELVRDQMPLGTAGADAAQYGLAAVDDATGCTDAEGPGTSEAGCAAQGAQ